MDEHACLHRLHEILTAVTLHFHAPELELRAISGEFENTDSPVGGAAESPSERATPMTRWMSSRAVARAWAFLFFALVLGSASAAAADSPRVVYRSPLPGARY